MGDDMKKISSILSFGGAQEVYVHHSHSCVCDMKFAVYIPPHASAKKKHPVLYWLSGLTCTEENFVTKSGFQRVASELGLIVVAPDTSPRGDGVPDDADGAYDFGLGAGFYLDATQGPWAKNYNMYSYIACELPALIAKHFPVDPDRAGLSGHSMGGHGALTIHLKHPDLFKSCSAFAPIVAPSHVPWGQKAFSNYLGEAKDTWAAYDATRLVEKCASDADILIDQGSADNFLEEQLRPALFVDAARQSGQKVTLRLQDGYDHSYYFIASFIEDHLRWHAKRL